MFGFRNPFSERERRRAMRIEGEPGNRDTDREEDVGQMEREVRTFAQEALEEMGGAEALDRLDKLAQETIEALKQVEDPEHTVVDIEMVDNTGSSAGRGSMKVSDFVDFYSTDHIHVMLERSYRDWRKAESRTDSLGPSPRDEAKVDFRARVKLMFRDLEGAENRLTVLEDETPQGESQEESESTSA